jgi:hypothetical protein
MSMDRDLSVLWSLSSPNYDENGLLRRDGSRDLPSTGDFGSCRPRSFVFTRRHTHHARRANDNADNGDKTGRLTSPESFHRYRRTSQLDLDSLDDQI